MTRALHHRRANDADDHMRNSTIACVLCSLTAIRCKALSQTQLDYMHWNDHRRKPKHAAVIISQKCSLTQKCAKKWAMDRSDSHSHLKQEKLHWKPVTTDNNSLTKQSCDLVIIGTTKNLINMQMNSIITTTAPVITSCHLNTQNFHCLKIEINKIK